MDSKSLERFNFILEKPLNLLTQDEISFLKARRGALNPMQREFYAEIIEEKVVTEELPSEEAPVKPKRTVKKKVETN